jgi:enterochelin esterase-like enzyme
MLPLIASLLFTSALAFGSGFEHHSIDSKVLNRRWNYATYVPSSVKYKAYRLPVVYMLHGFGDTEDMWKKDTNFIETIETQTARGVLPLAIYVFPSGNTTWYINSKEAMETAMVKELMPLIDKTYKTKSTRHGRVICGYSAGGYAALHFVLKFPKLFAAAVLFSPAVYNPQPPSNSAARYSLAFSTRGAFDPNKWTAFNYPSLLDNFAAKQIPIFVYTIAGDRDEFDIDKESATLHQILQTYPQVTTQLRIVAGGHYVMNTWGTFGVEGLRKAFTAAAVK